MITAYALVIIRSCIVIESADREVQHAIILVRILQDALVDISQRECLLCCTLTYEIAIIQITPVYRPHIHETKQCQQCHHRHFLQFAETIEHQNAKTDEYDDE